MVVAVAARLCALLAGGGLLLGDRSATSSQAIHAAPDASRGRRSPRWTTVAEPLAADPCWTAREQAAWTAVEAIAANVRPAELTDRDRVLNLGIRTIEAVARQIHPQDRNPLWKFTIPEALALSSG